MAEYLVPERLGFYGEVASIAASYAGRSVVDIGCGSGNLLRELLDLLERRSVPIVRVLALDHARSALERTAKLVPEAEARVFDIMRDDLDGEKFDLVLCTEVLEHLRRPEVARNQLAQACAPEGTILITVPDGATDDWEGHLNFWEESDLRTFLEPVGPVTISRTAAGQGLVAVIKPM